MFKHTHEKAMDAQRMKLEDENARYKHAVLHHLLQLETEVERLRSKVNDLSIKCSSPTEHTKYESTPQILDSILNNVTNIEDRIRRIKKADNPYIVYYGSDQSVLAH
jgi:hypothetical protein